MENKEKHFRIVWTIDAFGENPLEAIKKAMKAFPSSDNPDSLATVFDVTEYDDNMKVVNTEQIDLLEDEDEDDEETDGTILIPVNE